MSKNTKQLLNCQNVKHRLIFERQIYKLKSNPYFRCRILSTAKLTLYQYDVSDDVTIPLTNYTCLRQYNNKQIILFYVTIQVILVYVTKQIKHYICLRCYSNKNCLSHHIKQQILLLYVTITIDSHTCRCHHKQ